MHRLRLLTLGLLGLAACSSQTPSAPSDEPGGPNYLYAHAFPGATLGERISAAVAALPPSGGVVDATDYAGTQRIDQTIQVGTDRPVELRLGTVRLTASVVPFELHPNAKLIGNGQTVVTQDSGANLEWLITGTNVTDCEIARLTVDGNRAGNTAAASGIGLHTTERCWLHHLTVQNTVGRFHPGIAFFDGPNRNNTIEYNQVQSIGTLVDYADGIYVSGQGNRVLFNRIVDATDFAIVGEACVDCLVYGNQIKGVPGGIAIGSGIANTSAGANIIDANTIRGGFTTTLGMISIYRLSGSPPVSTIIRGNIIRDVEQGHAIFLKGAEQVSVEGNVMGNIGLAYPSYGILVQDSKDVMITGGAIDSTGSFGIGIGGSANVGVDGVLITDAGRSGNDASGIGLDVTATSSSSVSLTRLHIFDRDTIPAQKRMQFCIDFGQAGATVGVSIGQNLFDDGVNAIGCREGTVRIRGATRVSSF